MLGMDQKRLPQAEDRDNPTRQDSSGSDYSLMEFMERYPDDAACLDRLWRDRYAPGRPPRRCPKCERERKFHRTKTRASYTCNTCGLHVHPMKGTIFEKSTTSLKLWFYAMYLMASTRCGISAKQLEREIGVTYKTAHRMMKKIRTELMTDDDCEPLKGDVEIDETPGAASREGRRSEDDTLRGRAEQEGSAPCLRQREADRARNGRARRSRPLPRHRVPPWRGP